MKTAETKAESAPAIPKNAVCIWKPNPGKQEAFLSCPEREVLYGGAAGAGKSDALLMHAVKWHKNSAHRAIIFRKSFPELKDLISRSEEIYPYLGGRYISSRREWRFPSGARVEFGYMEKKKDVLKYKRAWNTIDFDELTHWPGDGKDAEGNIVNTNYLYLIGSRLRSVTGSGLPLETRSTTNPGGPGHEWVRSRFKIPDEGADSEMFDPRTKTFRIFIPGRIADCPQLSGTTYESDLDNLPEDTRRMLKDGRWDIVAGAMYSEFDHRKHTCDAFILPEGTRIWRGADDGYNAPACVLWFAEVDKRTYVIDELYKSGMVAPAMAEETKKKDLEFTFRNGVGDLIQNKEIFSGPIDPSAFNEDGMTAGSGRAQKMNQLGCRWKPAQKGPGSRIAGCNLVHQMLQKKLPDGKPQLMFFKNCKNLIRTLPTLPKDESNPEDVDTNGDDHCFTAGTMIQTASGLRRIASIEAGEMILTRNGYFPAILAGQTSRALVWRLRTKDGRELFATGNHKVLTQAGWKRFDRLTPCDTVFECKSQESFQTQSKNMQEFATTCAETIFKAMELGFIGKFIQTDSEELKKDSTFIIKTQIGQIMRAAISKRKLNMTTFQTTEEIQQQISARREARIQSLLQNLMRFSLRASVQKLRAKDGKKSRFTQSNAKCASVISKLHFLNARNSAAGLVVLEIEDVSSSHVEQTFNLTVAGTPEFLANGILVHNCYDSMRYGLQWRPKTLDVGKVTGV